MRCFGGHRFARYPIRIFGKTKIMGAVPAVKYVSIEEYLATEERSQEKHEYYAGEVYAMAGAGVPHNRIVRNALSNIDAFLRGKNCEVFPSDLKINVQTKSSFVYPDLSIVCNGLQFYRDRNDVITNPSVIIEVVSQHTERYDRGKKFMLYRQIPSLKEYFLISSMEMRVEKFTKTAPDAWTMKEFIAPKDAVLVDSIGCELTVAEFYRDVTFDEMPGAEELAPLS